MQACAVSRETTLWSMMNVQMHGLLMELRTTPSAFLIGFCRCGEACVPQVERLKGEKQPSWYGEMTRMNSSADPHDKKGAVPSEDAPPSTDKNGFPNVRFLLVFAAFLALALLQYTWKPLAGVVPEVLPLLFLMAVVLIGLLCECATRLIREVRSAVHADSRKDLRADIADLEATLMLRKVEDAQHKPEVATHCNILLQQAKDRCAKGQVNAAWRSFVQARLQSLYLFKDDDARVKICAFQTLSRSAVELDSWRRAAVKSILEDPGKPGKLKNQVTVDELYSANKVLEEYTNDRFDSLDRSAWQLYILSAAALVSMVVLAFALPSISTSEPSLLLDDRLLVPIIIIVGALGGATGGFFSVLRWFKTEKTIAHEQTMSSWMIAIRPLMGAVFALAVSLFLFSGFLKLGEVSLELLLSICFVAGFSEHFVIDIVNRIVKEGTSAKETSEKEE